MIYLSVLEDDLAVGDDDSGHAEDGHALEYVEVVGLMVVGDADGAAGLGVPDDDVGVGALGDAALARIDVERLGGVGAGHGHEAARVHLARAYALLPHDAHALFDAVDAVGDLGEVVFAEGFLVRVEDAVVGAGELEVAVGEQVHEEAGRRGVVAQRRRHHVAGTVAPALVEVVGAVGAEAGGDRLADHHTAASARVRDDGGARLAHHVNDVDRAVDLLGDGDGAHGRLGLELLGPREQVALGTGDAERLDLLLALVDEVAVLGVDERNGAELLAALEQLDEVLVLDHERVLVGHEALERVDALLLGQHIHLLGHLVVVVVDARVEGVVAAGLLLRARLVQIVGLDERHVAILQHEVHDRGGAASESSARARVEVVGGARAHEVELKVRVRVDAARYDELALGVDDLRAARHGQILANLAYHAVLHEHVGQERLVMVDNAAAFDQQSVLRTLHTQTHTQTC